MFHRSFHVWSLLYLPPNVFFSSFDLNYWWMLFHFLSQTTNLFRLGVQVRTWFWSSTPISLCGWSSRAGELLTTKQTSDQEKNLKKIGLLKKLKLPLSLLLIIFSPLFIFSLVFMFTTFIFLLLSSFVVFVASFCLFSHPVCLPWLVPAISDLFFYPTNTYSHEISVCIGLKQITGCWWSYESLDDALLRKAVLSE